MTALINKDSFLTSIIESSLINHTVEELAIEQQVDYSHSKSYAATVLTKKITEIMEAQFQLMGNVQLKCISVNCRGTSLEHVSYQSAPCVEILSHPWNTSGEIEKRLSKKQIFLFYEKPKNEYGKFKSPSYWKVKGCKVFRFGESTLLDIGKEYNRIHMLISKGVKVKEVKRGNSFINVNNLPKAKDTNYIHLRPKAKNKEDLDMWYFENYNIPLTKQGLFLNKDLINKIFVI